MWIGMLLLLGLAIFIVWDSRRLRNEVDKPLSRKTMAAGYVPRGIVAWHFWLGMSVVAGLMDRMGPAVAAAVHGTLELGESLSI